MGPVILALILDNSSATAFSVMQMNALQVSVPSSASAIIAPSVSIQTFFQAHSRGERTSATCFGHHSLPHLPWLRLRDNVDDEDRHAVRAWIGPLGLSNMRNKQGQMHFYARWSHWRHMPKVIHPQPPCNICKLSNTPDAID